jgi:hypothetical protein
MNNNYRPNLDDLIKLVNEEFPLVKETQDEPIHRWDTSEINTIIDAGRALWKSLSTESREEYYYGTGSYGFLEDLLDKLDIPCTEDELQFSIIHDVVVGLDPSEQFR